MTVNTLKEYKKPMTKKTINKILKVNKLQIGAKNPRYRVTIEDMDKEEIIYQVESFAGVISTMETSPEFQREVNQQDQQDMAMIAVAQKLAWGHPVLSLWCLDQLKEAIRPHLEEVRKFVKDTMDQNS